MKIWTPERIAELEGHMNAGLSASDAARAMGLSRTAVLRKCKADGIVRICIDCKARPRYQRYRVCASCHNIRNRVGHPGPTPPSYEHKAADNRYLKALRASGRDFS